MQEMGIPFEKIVENFTMPQLERTIIEKAGYSVYEWVKGNSTEGKWSAALLEITDSPRHFHRIEKEIFIVVDGILDIEIDSETRTLKEGESVLIHPGTVHKLRSHGKDPVRVLCFSFPAFDPSDMFCLE